MVPWVTARQCPVQPGLPSGTTGHMAQRPPFGNAVITGMWEFVCAFHQVAS